MNNMVRRIQTRQRAEKLDGLIRAAQDKLAVLQALSAEDLRILCVLHGLFYRRFKSERLESLRVVYGC